MKFKVKTSDFVESIRIATRGVSKAAVSNVLEGILFEAKDKVLTLYATDLRISIRTVLPCEVYEDGIFVLNSNLISEIARKMQGEYCDVTIDENICEVKSGRSVLKFAALESKDFPPFPTLAEEGSLKVKGEDFVELIQKSKVSVSLDENRLIYTGIKFESKDGFLTATALDGYRISLTRKKTDDNTDIHFIVPSSTLYDVEKLITDGDDVLIRMSESHAMITFGRTDIYTRLFEGEFFDFKPLILTEGKTEVTIDRKAFSDALDRAMIIARGNINMVRLTITDGNMNLMSKGSIGETNDDIEIEKTGDDLLIAFNPRYLRDGINIFEDDKIKLLFTESTNAATIYGVKDVVFTYIVLPVRLQ